MTETRTQDLIRTAAAFGLVLNLLQLLIGVGALILVVSDLLDGRDYSTVGLLLAVVLAATSGIALCWGWNCLEHGGGRPWIALACYLVQIAVVSFLLLAGEHALSLGSPVPYGIPDYYDMYHSPPREDDESLRGMLIWAGLPGVLPLAALIINLAMSAGRRPLPNPPTGASELPEDLLPRDP